jgi:hypothetical protein
MMVKHLNDAKSALILCSENQCPRLKEIVSRDIAERIDLIEKTYRELLETISQRTQDPVFVRELSQLVRSIRGGRAISEDEISSELSAGNFKRIARKILATILEGRSLASNELLDLVESLEKFSRATQESSRK